MSQPRGSSRRDAQREVERLSDLTKQYSVTLAPSGKHSGHWFSLAPDAASDPYLSPTAFRVLSVLGRFCDSNDGSRCYPSVDRVAELVGRDKRHVRRALRELELANYLELEASGGGRCSTNLYRVLFDPGCRLAFYDEHPSRKNKGAEVAPLSKQERGQNPPPISVTQATVQATEKGASLAGNGGTSRAKGGHLSLEKGAESAPRTSQGTSQSTSQSELRSAALLKAQAPQQHESADREKLRALVGQVSGSMTVAEIRALHDGAWEAR